MPLGGNQIIQGVFGRALGTLLDIPARMRLNQARPQTSPSANIPQMSAQQTYEQAQQGFAGGTNVQNYNGITREQFGQVEQRLQQFRNPATGQIDWTKAQLSGALAPLGVQPNTVSVSGIGESGYNDIQTALGAAQTDQQRALGLGRQALADNAALQGHFGQTQKDAAGALANLEDRVDQGQAQSLQQAATFENFQAQQMQQLQGILTEGLGLIDAEKAEALDSISANLASDVAATTSASRQNFQQQMSMINSDPNIPPEQRAQLQSQLGYATAQQAAEAAAPVVRMYREIESHTRNTFATLLTQFESAGASATASLQSSQQASRAGVVENLARVGAELTGILGTAQASRNSLNATVDNLRLQAEATKDDYMLGLLPHQQTPFAVYTPLLETLYGLNLDEDMLAYQEEHSNFGIQMAIEGRNMQAYFPWQQQGLTPEPPTPEDTTGATLGGAAIQGFGSVTGAVVPNLFK